MNESDKPFSVKDRRHFTPDGRVRDEPEESPEPESQTRDAEAGSGEGAPSETPPSTTPVSDGEARSRAAADEPGAGSPHAGGGADGPMDFGQFVLSLGAQAGMILSGQGLPEGSDPAESLAGARSIISILEMLEKKTAGNRTPEETQILEGLLYELRMAYVERSRGGGS